MVKYFIERKDGLWMSDPNEEGASWTNNPLKAWAFDRKIPDEPSQEEFDKLFAYKVRQFLEWESGTHDLIITEHAFYLGRVSINPSPNRDVYTWQGKYELHYHVSSGNPGEGGIINFSMVDWKYDKRYYKQAP